MLQLAVWLETEEKNEQGRLAEPSLDAEGAQDTPLGNTDTITEAEYNAHIAFNNIVQHYYEEGRIDPTQIEEVYIH